MTVSLSADELQTAQALLHNYGPAQPAIASLQQHQGDLEASLEELVVAAAGTAVYGDDRKTLRQVFLANLNNSRKVKGGQKKEPEAV